MESKFVLALHFTLGSKSAFGFILRIFTICSYTCHVSKFYIFLSGESVYHFDNKTAIDVPSYILQYTGAESMTISTWIWMQKNKEQQFIISASDPERLDRKHFGLYTEGKFSSI